MCGSGTAPGYSTGKSVKTSLFFSWRRHQDRFELFREERYHFVNGYFIKGVDTAAFGPGIYYPGHNYHLTNSFNTGLNIVIPGKSGNSAIGMEYNANRIRSNVLGASLNTPVAVPGEERGLFTNGAEREIFNFYLNHIQNFGFIYVSLGALLSASNDYGYKTCFGGEISKTIRKHSKLFFTVNQSLRLPTYTDLYYNGPTNEGNLDLKPERATTLEMGNRTSVSWINIEISAFDRIGTNIIDWVKLPEEDKYTTRNHTRLNTYGLNIATGINTGTLPALGTLIKNIHLSYSLINTYKYSGEYISAYALDYLKHKLSGRFDLKVYRTVGLSWNCTLQDRNGTYTDRDGMEHAYKPYFLVNARLYWTPGILEVFLETSNLFNVEYRDLGSIIQPGFWLFAGLNTSLSPSDPH